MGPSFNRLFTSHRRQLESGRMLQFNLLILLLFLTVACVSKTRVFTFLASFSSKSKSPLGYVARPHLSKRKFLVNNIHKLKKKKKIWQDSFGNWYFFERVGNLENISGKICRINLIRIVDKNLEKRGRGEMKAGNNINVSRFFRVYIFLHWEVWIDRKLSCQSDNTIDIVMKFFYVPGILQ